MLIPAGESSSKKKQKPAIADEGIATLFKSAAVLRIGAGAVMAWFHAWPGLVGGYKFLWKEQPWDCVAALDAAHVPFPHLVAPLAAIVVASVALSWMLGFVTRLFSLAAIPAAIVGFVVAQRAGSLLAETCALYFFIAVTLLLFGSGSISLDWFFSRGQSGKAPPKIR
ncbi:MAG: hypothetical protein K1X78_12645 [Verrucomicrobiaceae bacterium]|nr:hypothetical protein [Verrucomicrobiaceae bacterium]